MVQPASGIPASGHGTHFELNTEIVRSRFHILNPPLFLFFPSLSLSQSMVYAARYVNAAQPSGCEGKVGGVPCRVVGSNRMNGSNEMLTAMPLYPSINKEGEDNYMA